MLDTPGVVRGCQKGSPTLQKKSGKVNQKSGKVPLSLSSTTSHFADFATLPITQDPLGGGGEAVSPWKFSRCLQECCTLFLRWNKSIALTVLQDKVRGGALMSMVDIVEIKLLAE